VLRCVLRSLFLLEECRGTALPLLGRALPKRTEGGVCLGVQTQGSAAGANPRRCRRCKPREVPPVQTHGGAVGANPGKCRRCKPTEVPSVQTQGSAAGANPRRCRRCKPREVPPVHTQKLRAMVRSRVHSVLRSTHGLKAST